MEIIRNLTRRKLRNILTISGIVIGVLALVTRGLLAEKFNALLAGGANYFGSNIQVSDDTAGAFGGFGGGGLLSLDKVQQVEAVPGVAAAFPEVSVSAKPGATNVVSFGVSDFIASSNAQENNYGTFHTRLAQGREINADGSGEVVLGADFAAEFKKTVGDTIQLPVRPKDAPADFVTHRYNVVGVLAKTYLSSAIQKFEAGNRTEAARVAEEQGWL